MKCMRKGVKKNHTRERKWSWDRRESGEVIWSERERCLGRWEVRNDWERLRRNVVRNLFIEIPVSRWIKRFRELSRIKTREIDIDELSSSYREVSTANKLRWINKLSSIYQASRNFLNGSSSCWEAIKIESQESQWIEIMITAIVKGSSKGSIDSLVVERYREAAEIA